VSQLKKDWGDASWIPIAVGGAGSGAAIGAAGFAATPLVGAVTTIGGALVGAGAALLNQDQIEDQAARASVQTGMAAEQFGFSGALSTGLRQWGGVAGQVAQPLSNTVQGLTDLGGGSIGDDVST